MFQISEVECVEVSFVIVDSQIAVQLVMSEKRNV